jgi:TfoX/Sxy family transcriptional regulator of competence genes
MAYNEDLAKRLRAHLGRVHGLQEKKMFGGIGFLVNGNMACGVHGDDLIIRVNPADHDAALKLKHVKQFDMTGRPMKGWIVVQRPGYASDEALKNWIAKSVRFARSLAPK